ncbi:MipA/OmpV family protein [Acanthopleuribacter pedis]|uniref:MipA/OmpV family protein n=1 Tax=Acanthopleuribacter pedis TaxID=442870 RepID=A0A8J7Q3F0_9BACT|nr:MipA/OmpV family protein [Acanthopleuribacter pedis]MBO1317234.1 MipA/OmpV family protein [Acanthopleuribacter pedis]MBO1318540.1 MipA/OmpV family protein [Acanthopleuribacter pedis]
MPRLFSLFALLLFGFLQAQPPAGAEPGPPRFSLGLGLLVNDNAYAGQDSEVIPIPLLTYRSGRFTFQGIRASYALVQSRKQTFEFALQPRFESYEEDDSEVLRGMEDREKSLDLGLAYQRNFGRNSLNFEAMFDVLDRSGGYELDLSLQRRHRAGMWILSGDLSLGYRDKNNTDYYYGVTLPEALPTRPFYQPDAAVIPAVGVQVIRPLGRSGWQWLSIFNTSFLPSTIEDSPIVDKSRLSTFLTGFSYRFK